MTTRPISTQPHYGTHLGDPSYWGPYVRAALERSGLPAGVIEAPFLGTFPTFLVGDVVVKIFGPAFDGHASFAAEAAMHDLLAQHATIAAPAVVAHGALFGDDWPFLITTRLHGAAVRDVGPTPAVAAELGRLVAALHELPAPGVVAARDLLPSLRRSASARLGRFGLPAHLVEQVPAYLTDALPATTLVHADITEDHVFVRDRALEGVIDWGDAFVADAYYELVALFLGALAADRALWRVFLDGYGWESDDQFARHALQAVLTFQFNAIDGVRHLVELDTVKTLDQLAVDLFGSL